MTAKIIPDVSIKVTIEGTEYEGSLGFVEDITLGYEDHGLPTSFVHVNYIGSGQGFGGRVLREQYMYWWVSSMLRVFDVDEWSKIKGKMVITLKKENSPYIDGVMHPLRHDLYFLVDELEQKDDDSKKVEV